MSLFEFDSSVIKPSMGIYKIELSSTFIDFSKDENLINEIIAIRIIKTVNSFGKKNIKFNKFLKIIFKI